MPASFASAFSPVPPKLYGTPVVPQDVPAYRILRPCFLDDKYLVEGSIVTFLEEPNQYMEPLNDLAREAIEAFFDEREKLGEQVTGRSRRKYNSAFQKMKDARKMNTEESRRAQLMGSDEGVPIMGARKRGRPKATVLETTPLDPTPVHNLTRTANESRNLGIE